ncbi:PKD domain-containing protein [Hyphobacterium sp. CCMP332]|nr:PKD domain-containing protein [Hyphobacterium sp. CCMP332]
MTILRQNRWRGWASYGKIFAIALLTLLSTIVVQAQYNATQSGASAGNPGGTNTDSDFSTTGWTEVLPPSISTNQWSAAFPLTFAFDFAGTPVTHFKASGNGLVTFDTSATGVPANTPEALPSDSLPNNTIASYWAPFTGFAPTGTNDRVYWKEFGTAPNRQFWIRWHSYEWGPGGAFFYNAVVLEETSNKIYCMEMYGGTGVTGTSVGVQVNNTTGVDGSSSWNLQGLGSGNTDNQYWQFAPPLANDLATTAILSPVNGCVGASETGTVEISNFGTSSIDFSVNNTPVTLSVDTNGSLYTSISTTLTTGTLASGATMMVNIPGTIDMSGANTYDFTASAVMPGDQDASNDVLTGYSITNSPNFALPQVLDFDAWTGSNATLPAGWTEARGPAQGPPTGTASDWFSTNTTQAAFLGSEAATINIFSNANPGEWISGPKFTTVSGNEVVAIKTAVMAWSGGGTTNPSLMGSDDTVSIMISTDCGASYSSIKDFTRADSSILTGSFSFNQYPIGVTAGNEVLVGIYATSGITADAEDFYFYMDDLIIGQPITCPAPSGLASTGIGFSTVDLTWNSNGTGTAWEVEYGAPGYTAGTGGTSSFVSSTSPTISGLSAATGYDIYVREICGSNDSSFWVGPLSIFTNCAPFTAPFVDSIAGPNWAEPSTIDPCWSAQSTSTYVWLPESGTTTSGSTGPSADADGSGLYAYTEATSGGAGDVAELYTPFIDVSGLSAAELTFKYHMYGATMGTLAVDVNNNGTWINDVFNVSGQQQAASADPWLSASVILACVGVTSDTVQFRFRGIRGTSFTGDMAIDEIRVENLAAGVCPDPALFTSTSVGTTNASFSFTSCGPGTSFILEYGAPGYTAGTGTGVAGTGSPASISGLLPATSYDVYLREVCAPGDSSNWVGPVSIQTPCLTYSAPLSESFDSTSVWTAANVDPCWSKIPTGSSGFSWRADANGTSSTATGPADDVSGGGQYMYTEASSPAGVGDTAWLLTPFIDMSGMTLPQANFWYHMYGSDMGSMHFEWQDSATGVWTNLWSQAGAVQTTNADPFIENNIVLAPGLGTIRFRWVGVYGSGFNGDMAIDEFSITEAPTCPKPSALLINSVTTMTADISWTSNASGSTWEIQYDTAGFVPGTGIFQSSTDTFATISGLMQSTGYDVYVREICGAGDTSTWLSGSFNTTIGNPSLCGINQLLPDGNGPNWFEIPIDASNASGANLGADVFVSAVHLILDHTYTSDVVMELVSPAGDTVLLFDGHGGSGDHFGLNNGACDTVLTFTDTASTPISAGTTPFIGPYAPDSALSGFNSGSPAGTWILRYQDNFGADQGTLQYIEIEFGVGNDVPCNAAELVVGAAPASFTNEGTGFDAAEPTGSCWTDGSGGTSGVLDNTVWMYFVAPVNAAYFVTTNFPGTPNDDTQIAAYLASNGCGDYAGYTEIGCGEDIDATNWLSEMTTSAVTAGDTVYVQVDGWAATVGQFDIQVSQVAPPSAGFTYSATNQTVAFTDTSSGNPTSWSWDFGDGNTSTSQNPSHTYASGGTYTVCLTASNASGSDTTCESVMVISGLNNRLEQFAKVYPNPAKDRLVIEVKSESLKGYQIVDMMGRTILTSNENIVGTKEINVSDLASGNYIMKLNFGDEIALHKFIIQR